MKLRSAVSFVLAIFLLSIEISAVPLPIGSAKNPRLEVPKVSASASVKLTTRSIPLAIKDEDDGSYDDTVGGKDVKYEEWIRQFIIKWIETLFDLPAENEGDEKKKDMQFTPGRKGDPDEESDLPPKTDLDDNGEGDNETDDNGSDDGNDDLMFSDIGKGGAENNNGNNDDDIDMTKPDSTTLDAIQTPTPIGSFVEEDVDNDDADDQDDVNDSDDTFGDDSDDDTFGDDSDDDNSDDTFGNDSDDDFDGAEGSSDNDQDDVNDSDDDFEGAEGNSDNDLEENVDIDFTDDEDDNDNIDGAETDNDGIDTDEETGDGDNSLDGDETDDEEGLEG